MMVLRRRVQLALIFAAGLGAAAFAAARAGLTFNPSTSLPTGFYVRVDVVPHRGAIVDFCPPPTAPFAQARERGYIHYGHCPGRFEHMGKRIAGVPGDLVTETAAGVLINGRLLPGSAPYLRDPAGRPLPILRTQALRIPPGRYWLMGDGNPLSFDSRYFGLVNADAVRHVVKPLWTW